MENLLKVGIADMKIAKTEDGIITYALGSCIGVCMYDSMAKIVGMVHIMLPAPPNPGHVDNAAKYATTGVPELLNRMIRMGASRVRIKAKIAGGAKMFALSNGSSIGDIGRRNAAAVKDVLHAERIQIVAEDCGANYARTLSIKRADGSALIKSYGHVDLKL